MAFRDKTDRLFLIKKEGRNAYIEGLRAFAIILVFNVHFFAQYRDGNYFFTKGSTGYHFFSALNAGHIGVDLFFILSGYLIYNILRKGDLGFTRFIYNRLKRLSPANFVVTLILAFGSFYLLKFILNVFFLQRFLISNPTYNFVNWSLSWEWLFYILIFFSIRLAGGNDRLLLLFMFLSIAFLAFNDLYFYQWLEKAKIVLPPAGRFANFFIGVVVGLVEKRNVRMNNRRLAEIINLFLIFIAIPFLAYCWSTEKIPVNIFYVFVGLAFGLLLFITNNSEVRSKNIFKLYPFRVLGQLSYSFYLIHAAIAIPIANTIFLYFKPVTSVSLMIVNYIFSFCFTALLAAIFYAVLERPFLLKKTKKIYANT